MLYAMAISVSSPAISVMRNPKLMTFYYLVPCSFVIFAFSFDKGLLSKLLGSKVFRFLGECSFAMYLVHQIVLYAVKRLWGAYIVDVGSMLMFGAIGFAISLAAAIVLRFAVEIPADRFLRARWDRSFRKR